MVQCVSGRRRVRKGTVGRGSRIVAGEDCSVRLAWKWERSKVDDSLSQCLVIFASWYLKVGNVAPKGRRTPCVCPGCKVTTSLPGATEDST